MKLLRTLQLGKGLGRRQLLKTLKRKKRVRLKVVVTVSSASGGPSTTYTRKAKVKRLKRARIRR